MPSHNDNFINFIQSTFMFVHRSNVPIQHEKLKNFTVLHGIYAFEVMWSVAKVESCHLYSAWFLLNERRHLHIPTTT